MFEEVRIDLEDGKYTYIFDGDKQKILRHGQEWREPTGDGFLLAMVHYVKDLENALEDKKEESILAQYRAAALQGLLADRQQVKDLGSLTRDSGRNDLYKTTARIAKRFADALYLVDYDTE